MSSSNSGGRTICIEDEEKQLLYTSILTLENDYVEISRDSNNLFELPELRHMPDDERKEHLDDFQPFIALAFKLLLQNTC
jgi:hypothetical protein